MNKKGNVIVASIVIIFAVIAVFLAYENVSTKTTYEGDKITGMATAKSCVFSFQCNDNDPCSTDRCIFGRCMNRKIVCAKGSECVSGRCVSSPEIVCQDSDGGINLFVKGQVEKSTGTYSDFCISDNEVNEAYCSDQLSPEGLHSPSYISVKCPIGYYCSDGKCMEYSGELIKPTQSCTKDLNDLTTKGEPLFNIEVSTLNRIYLPEFDQIASKKGLSRYVLASKKGWKDNSFEDCCVELGNNVYINCVNDIGTNYAAYISKMSGLKTPVDGLVEFGCDVNTAKVSVFPKICDYGCVNNRCLAPNFSKVYTEFYYRYNKSAQVVCTSTNYNPQMDLNQDGIISSSDVNVLMENFNNETWASEVLKYQNPCIKGIVCEDSRNSFDIYHKSSVKTTDFNSVSFKYSLQDDRCTKDMGDNKQVAISKYLLEYVCSNIGGVKSYHYECLYGCANGSCIMIEPMNEYCQKLYCRITKALLFKNLMYLSEDLMNSRGYTGNRIVGYLDGDVYSGFAISTYELREFEENYVKARWCESKLKENKIPEKYFDGMC